MSKFKKQIILCVGITSLSTAITSNIPITSGMYDMRPKNHFRGGSIGKGGKVKYKRV